MKITPEEIDRLARLARLSLTEGERADMAVRLEEMLERIAPLAALEAAEEDAPPAGSVLRGDEPAPSLDRGELLKNAPAHDGESFLVPRTVGGGGDTAWS